METEADNEQLWDDPERAKNVSRELSRMKEEIGSLKDIKKEAEDIKELSNVLGEEDIKGELEKLEGKIKMKEREMFFSGKYDRGDAILSVYSGAGGQDAQDWAGMLFRMYERYCEDKNFKTVVLDESKGEGNTGIKSATIAISGKYAYGLLKRETGVHRLVRISPFSAQQLRHTSFALIEVLPEIEDGEIEINPDHLRVDYYKSSGPGGQYVNKRQSAVRITHIPTGIVVACQSERLLGKNKDTAMKVLLGKLYQHEQEEKEKELKGIKGEKISASWGNQIRSYVLHPYKMVKDLRTEVESSQPDKVLDGDLDQFIEAEIRL